MNRLAIAVDPPYTDDAVFDADSPLNRDDCLSWFRILRARLEELGGWCHTLDVCREQGLRPDVVLFLEVPPHPVATVLTGWDPAPEAWVALYECPVVIPRNWESGLHEQFAKILTWADPIVDGERYVKFNFANPLFVPEPLELDVAERNLCTLIAGNKTAPHPLELYSARREAIRWFEAHHPEHFDLYGMGWDRGGEQFPSYRGRVERKLEVLDRYWFTICFENARDIPGYITEKLFDSLLARSVPVYWGASNIAEHVPEAAFVDARRFSRFEELYDYLVSMEPEEYAGYLEAGREYLASGAARPFSDEGCAEVVVRELQHATLKN